MDRMGYWLFTAVIAQYAEFLSGRPTVPFSRAKSGLWFVVVRAGKKPVYERNSEFFESNLLETDAGSHDVYPAKMR